MSQYKSPLRYPGGKQRLVPFILEVMGANDLIGGEYAEPYAGGAGIAVELLLTGKASHIHLNDSCSRVHAFWRSILLQPEEFCRRISRASMTVDEWRRQKQVLAEPQKHPQFDLGFSMFYLNRCNRSGIIGGGVIGGLDQKGKWKIDARFPRNELIRRVEAIAAKKKQISVKNWDAERFIIEYVPKLPRKSLVYCDPPYFHKAERLYLNHYGPDDHERIARIVQQKLKRPWIVSYDCAPEILCYYNERRRFQFSQQYNAAKAYKGIEVLFFSDRVRVPEKPTLPMVKNFKKQVG